LKDVYSYTEIRYIKVMYSHSETLDQNKILASFSIICYIYL